VVEQIDGYALYTVVEIFPGSYVKGILAGNETVPGWVRDSNIGTNARFCWIGAIAIDSQDNIFVYDDGGCEGNNESYIRKITPTGRVITMKTFIGRNNIHAMKFDSADNLYFIKDNSCKLYKMGNDYEEKEIAGNGVCTPVDGIGSAAQISAFSNGMTIMNDVIYITEKDSQIIRKIEYK
jgi:hypothetical protein